MAGPNPQRQVFTTGQDLADKYTSWAARLGLTKSQFLSVACAIGANIVVRQAFPEEFITPDLLKQAMSLQVPLIDNSTMVSAIAKMMKTGKPVHLADGTVVGSEDLKE